MELQQLINMGKAMAYKRHHEQILLKMNVNEEGNGLREPKISKVFDISSRTIERTKMHNTGHG
jgi:Fic family protein